MQVLVTIFNAEFRTVNTHFCVLKTRLDPAPGGLLRWSLPKKERCYCQRIFTARWLKVEINSCPPMEEAFDNDDMWFIDEPRELTLPHNWRTDALDTLLERTEYCGNVLYCCSTLLYCSSPI